MFQAYACLPYIKSINLSIVSRSKSAILEYSSASCTKSIFACDLVLTTEPWSEPEITRNHWQIENSLHWILDVHFKEDFSMSKKDNSIFNLSLLRKICYNLIKLDDSFGKISFKKKLNRYNFDFQLLENLIFNVIPNVC